MGQKIVTAHSAEVFLVITGYGWDCSCGEHDEGYRSRDKAIAGFKHHVSIEMNELPRIRPILTPMH